MTYRLFSTLIGFLIASVIIILLRKDRLHTTYSFWWMTVAFVVFIVGIFPQIIDFFGGILGVSYPPILALITGLCLILVKILTMDIERSKQEKQIRILTQRLAILEQKLLSKD